MILVKHSITAVGTKPEGRNLAVDTEVKAASAERRAVSLQNVMLFLELAGKAVQAQGKAEDRSAHWCVAIENVPLLIPLRSLSLLLLLLLCSCLQSASFRQAGSESPETAARCCKAGGSRNIKRHTTIGSVKSCFEDILDQYFPLHEAKFSEMLETVSWLMCLGCLFRCS